MTERNNQIERRENCLIHDKEHDKDLKDLSHAVFGNARKGLVERVIRMEVMMWVVIALLLGNGGLIIWRL